MLCGAGACVSTRLRTLFPPPHPGPHTHAYALHAYPIRSIRIPHTQHTLQRVYVQSSLLRIQVGIRMHTHYTHTAYAYRIRGMRFNASTDTLPANVSVRMPSMVP